MINMNAKEATKPEGDLLSALEELFRLGRSFKPATISGNFSSGGYFSFEEAIQLSNVNQLFEDRTSENAKRHAEGFAEWLPENDWIGNYKGCWLNVKTAEESKTSDLYTLYLKSL